MHNKVLINKERVPEAILPQTVNFQTNQGLQYLGYKLRMMVWECWQELVIVVQYTSLRGSTEPISQYGVRGHSA